MKDIKQVCSLVALVAASQSISAAQLNTIKVSAKGGEVTITEEVLPDLSMVKTFIRDNKVLYESTIKRTENGIFVNISKGHESQLGSYELTNNLLEVWDNKGALLWSETLEVPLCPPELAPEFVKSYWTYLEIDSKPLECVVPIIKAEKVAPVKWVRLDDTDDGLRAVELRPGSFGMRFFLTPTRFEFNASGDMWIAQEGQFESTRDPDKWPRYLKGATTSMGERDIAIWEMSSFGVQPSELKE